MSKFLKDVTILKAQQIPPSSPPPKRNECSLLTLGVNFVMFSSDHISDLHFTPPPPIMSIPRSIRVDVPNLVTMRTSSFLCFSPVDFCNFDSQSALLLSDGLIFVILAHPLMYPHTCDCKLNLAPVSSVVWPPIVDRVRQTCTQNLYGFLTNLLHS